MFLSKKVDFNSLKEEIQKMLINKSRRVIVKDVICDAIHLYFVELTKKPVDDRIIYRVVNILFTTKFEKILWLFI